MLKTKHLTPIRLLLLAILGLYLFLTALYSLNTPPLEAPDAYYHFGVIEYIGREFSLPPRENPEDHPWTHAVFHAPLYYIISGLLIAPLDTSDFPELWPKNPHARIGLPHSLNNRNYVSIKGEPWRDTWLAVYVVRLLSMACGLLSLLSIFMLGRLMLPEKPRFALLATFFVALNPQFLYLSAVINNDNMVVAFGLLTLCILIRLIKVGYSDRWIMALAVLMALNALVKVNSLPLYPTVGLGLMYIAWRDKLGWPRLIRWSVILAAVWLIIAGWWYIDNFITYGDPTATEPLAEAAGGGSGVPTGLDNLWREFIGVYYSFWGLFGWFNIIAPPIFYDFITLMLAVMGLGLLYALLRHPASRDNRLIGLLLLFHAALVFAGWWRFKNMVSAAQGRMLFSILGALALAAAYGLSVWRFKLLQTFFLSGLGVAAIGFPLLLIGPSYRLPERLTSIPDGVNLVDVRYGPVVLRGYRINPEPVNFWAYEKPSDRELIEITLYWQPLEKTDIPLSMFVQVYAPSISIADDYLPIEMAKVDSYPGGGMMRTDNWETGIIYADTYYLEIYAGRDLNLTPFEPRFRVGLRDNETDTEIPATTREGEPIEAVIPRGGSVYSSALPCPNLLNPTNTQFGDLVRLIGYEIPDSFIGIGNTGWQDLTFKAGETFDLTLAWEVLNPTNEFYAVFVQLVAEDDITRQVGGGDSAPRADWYPTTRWVKGVCFPDRYTVRIDPDAPAGNYQLLVGFYNPQTFARLPVEVFTVFDIPYPYPDAYHVTPIWIEGE